MAKAKLPKAHLWEERELKDWNTNTFIAYMKDKHREVLGIEYVNPRGGVMQEKGMVKKFMDTHGNEITKSFIDVCFQKYTPKPQYPNLTFCFMKTYMESYNLPPLLAKEQQEVVEQKYEEKTEKLSTQDMLDLL